jgi:small subunit ribosomal protein S4
MGDPKKIRRKYSTPGHPWNKARIESDAELVKNFGLKNKKEIWRASAVLTGFKNQAKTLIAKSGSQADLERENLLKKVESLGLSNGRPTIDDILALKVEDVLARRLQSVVFKSQLSKSVKQSRQFITHRHVTVNGTVVTVPSYLVKVTDSLGFTERSALSDPEHSERYHEPEAKPEDDKDSKKNKGDRKKKKVDDEVEIVDDKLLKVADEEIEKKIAPIEDAEVL